MINLQEVGARAQAATRQGVKVSFGLYLPGIKASDGYEVRVFVLPKKNHFSSEVTPREFSLTHVKGSENDLWQATITLKPDGNTAFGRAGTYLYRYQLLQQVPDTDKKKVVTRWFTDPFALSTDIGLLSAFTTPDAQPKFSWHDKKWKVPELESLVVYELNVEEFNSNFEGVIERLNYLRGLGVTCIELMPVTSLKLNFNWGYEPLHYFAPYERWGGVTGLKRLVDACHQAGMAIILDVVYQHVDPSFPYHVIYWDTGIESPMTGGDGPFGPEIDYEKEFACHYIQTVNHYWLHEFHVDGFRYDEVTDLYDGPVGIKYARIAYDTYQESLKIARFTPTGQAGEYSRLIHCSEALNRPQEVLATTYTNCTWQDTLLGQAENMARSNKVDENFGLQVILDGNFARYPTTKEVQDIKGKPVEMPVIPFQYLENHDHSRLIAALRTLEEDIPSGDRTLYYKLQPFVVALYTCVGIPMLWQGQELVENYILPDAGMARVRYRRDVNWENFYDEYGVATVRLYRTLGRLRHGYPALRSREGFYYNDESRIQDGIIAYRRTHSASKQVAIVLLNFSDQTQSIGVPVPEAGKYREMMDHKDRQKPLEIKIKEANQLLQVEVPSHYGYVFLNA
jgi:maltooligosyltrehalose trehalohydrolase